MPKTIIELQQEVMKKLDLIAKKRSVSRSSLVRQAIEAWLEKQEASVKSTSNVFGILKNSKEFSTDSVDIQNKLRSEWK